MKGILLCKFDENKGYIPIWLIPARIYSEDNKDLFKNIAKNAIGFGTSIEYNQFELHGIHAISRRFTRTVSNARGGVEIYSIVLLMEELTNNFDRSILEDVTNRLIENWDDRKIILREIYDVVIKKVSREQDNDENLDASTSFSQSNMSNNKYTTIKNGSKPRKSAIFKDELIEKEKSSIFAAESNKYRNIIMTGAMAIVILILVFGYDLISFLLLLNFGALFYSFINNRKKLMRISVGILSIFIIYIIIGIILLLFYDISLLIQPTFPDVLIQPHFSLLSFLCGFLICIGLDRGKKVDKNSTVIGIVFLVIDFLLFLIIIPIILSL
jgi:hypothetical protein